MPKGDPFTGPEWHRYVNDVRKRMVPAMRDSAYVMSIVPGEPDVKFAVELGLSIMMDKPLFVVVPPGRSVPDKLVQIADKLVQMTDDPEETSLRIQAAITEYQQEHPDD